MGTGGYGTQYALSAGCAVRVGDRLHLNGALSYSPSVDYEYGSTSSVAGRLGFSFPLGRIAKASKVSTSEIAEYRSEMNANLLKLQSDVQSRDQQIDALKAKLEALLQQQPQAGADAPTTSQATEELVAMLRERIDQLEAEKRQSAQENAQQNARIAALESKLAKQQTMFEQVMNRLKTLMPGDSKP